MTWVKLDDGFPEMPAIVGLTDRAFRAYIEILCYVARQQTGGFVPRPLLTPGVATRLTEAGLIEATEAGWHLIAWDGFKIHMVRPRPHLAAHLRRQVMERDGYRCVFCGATDDLSMDHIFPWSLGGSDTLDNLQTLCRPCNSSKGARL